MDNLMTWLHLVSVVAWIGAMILHLFIVVPSVMKIGPMERGAFMGSYLPRFSPFMWASMSLVLVTGFALVGMIIGFSDIFRFDSHYNAVILVKMVIVLIMVGNAIYITFILTPNINAAEKAPGGEGGGPNPEFIRLAGVMTKFGYSQLALGLIALFLAATL